MAEALYIPRFTPPPPANPRVNFWTALDWDPYEERINNGVHIVRDGKQAGVYLADGNDLIQLSRIPAVDPANLGNVVLRTLASEGLVNGQFLPDELRYGNQPYLEPGRCALLNGLNQYIHSAPAANIPTAFPFTLSAWFYSTSSSADQAIMGIGDSTWYFNYYHLYYDGTSQRLKTQRRDNDFAVSETCGSVVVAPNTWHHVAICYLSTTSFKYSINGSNWVTVSGVTAKNFPAANHYVAGVLRVVGGEAKLTGRLFDCRWWNRELTQAELDTVHTFGSVSSGLVNHWWLAETHTPSYVDSSGNGNRGTAANYTLAQFYQGNDVPWSPANEIGWSPSYTGTNLWSNPTFNMSAALGTTPPTVSYGTFFGRTANKIDFTAASDNGYNGSRVQSPGANVTLPQGKWYRCSCLIRPSRPLTGPEQIYWYWTGTGGTTGYWIDPNLGTTWYAEPQSDGWIRIVMGAFFTSSSAWTIYPVVYKTFLNSDFTLYITDHRCYEDFGNPVLPLSTNTANSLRGSALEYKGKCPARPLPIDSNCLTLNGTTQYVPIGTGTWSTDGTQPMEFSGWFKTSSGSASLVSNMLTSGTFKGWDFMTSAGKVYVYYIADLGANDYIEVSTGPGFNDDTWHHLRITYNGSKTAAGIAVFVDGVQWPLTVGMDTLTGSTANTSVTSCIGVRNQASQLFGGSIVDPKLTIGSNSWGYRLAEGNGSTVVYDYINGTNHGIANAGNNWNVVQRKVHPNLVYGYRSGVNRLKDSKSLVSGYQGNQVNRTEVGDMLSGAKICRLTKANTTGSTAYSTVALPTTATETLTFSLSLRATSNSSQASFGVYHLANGWANTPVSCSIISGPGAVTQFSGSLWIVTGLSQTEFIRVRVTGTYAAGSFIYPSVYPDTSSSVTAGREIDAAEWQLELGNSASPFFLTIEESGLVRIPAMRDNPLLAANGLPITHPAGDWHNLAETKFDFSCGQPLAPLFNGVTPPTAWKPGDVVTGLTSEKYSNKERAITLSR